MARILFITSTRLGDAVLSTGLIGHMLETVPDPRFTIVCGSLPASLFEGVPGLEKLIVLKKQKYNRHWIELWKQVAGTKWDIVVDLRNSLVSRLIRSKRKFIHGAQKGHKVVQNAAVMKLETVPAPRLFPTDAQKDRAARLVPGGAPVLAVGPTANWIGKTWPADNFIRLVRLLTAECGVLPFARLAVFAAPGEAAAALARCALFVGNDSGLMHCAAAAGVPTIGLFGASYADIYGPYGAHTAYARTPESFDELKNFPGYDPKTLKHSLMTSLSVEHVLQTINQFARSSSLLRLNNMKDSSAE